MANRIGVCEGCSTPFVAGARGKMPVCCPECSQNRRREKEKVWAAARPPRQKIEHTIVCGGCSVEFQWALRGPQPVRCKECAKDRRRAASREAGRLRRLAAKTGDPVRHQAP